jgi:tartrate/fumarate subfamily iron-sulfur-dependent hydro-lyase beta chain
MAEYHLQSPLSDNDVQQLKIGDAVYLNGPSFTCRSRLHRYVFDEGHPLPFSTEKRNMLIHTGPIIIREDERWKLVSFMPTSSIRFEKWGARSVEEWGLKLICGKTTMGEQTAEMMRKRKCVHVSPRSVSPNLWVDSIKIEDVHLIDELGSIEAAWFLELEELGPFVVDIDCEGNNLFEKFGETVDANRKKAYEMLNIPEDFKYTKLY